MGGHLINSRNIPNRAEFTRRALLSGGFATLLLLHPKRGRAGPLDSIPLTPRAKVLRQGSIVVPGHSSNGPGLAAFDIFSPARAWLDVDFAVQDKAEITLMILTPQQKAQVFGGQPLMGDPLARDAIEGPETANHSVVVGQGSYFVAFLNDELKRVTVIYRASVRAF